MLRGLSVKAVLVGVVLDWLLSLVVGLIGGAGILLYFTAVLHGSPADRTAVDALLKSDLLCAGICLGGGLASAVVGFVAGWIARSHRVKNAFAALPTVPPLTWRRPPFFRPPVG